MPSDAAAEPMPAPTAVPTAPLEMQPELIEAASLILMREADGAPELLIVRRAPALAFAGGAYAFPGGRVDATDRALADTLGGDLADVAARIASLRELQEETGLDLGDDGATATGLDRLIPFARWSPPALGRMRRFDTRFYLAEALTDARLEPDGGEIIEVFWSTASALLGRCERGEGRVLFPTRCLLERLASFATCEAARAQAAIASPRMIRPLIVTEGNDRWLTIPADAGYPYTRQLLRDDGDR